MATLHIVLRVSSEEQAKDGEKGFDVQLDNIIRFVDSIPRFDEYEIMVYPFTQSSIEPHFLEDRPDLVQILDMVKLGDIPCYFNMERLSRDAAVRSEFIQHLRHKKKIAEIIISNKIYNLNDSSDNMTMGVYSTITEKQTQEDMLRKKEAKKRHQKEGKYTGHMIPLGYGEIRKEDKHYHFIKDPEKSKIYKRIVELCLQGKSCSDIAQIFNGENLPTCRAGQEFKRQRAMFWQGGTILYILKNPFYYGVIRHKDEDKKRYEIIQGEHEPLISKEKWDLVQGILSKRITRPGPQGTKIILFRDVLYCRKCGNRILGRFTFVKRTRKPSYELRQYVCSHRWVEKEFRDRREKCNFPLIDMDNADNFIWNLIKETVKDSNKLREAVERNINGGCVNKAELELRLGQIKKEIEHYEKAIYNLLSYASLGHWEPKLVDDQAKEFKNQIAKLQGEYSLVQDSLSGEEKLNNSLATLEQRLQRVKADIDNYTDKEKYEFIGDIVDKIWIDYVDGCFTAEIEGAFNVLEWGNDTHATQLSPPLCPG